MTLDEYYKHCDGLRLGLIAPGGVCRLDAPPRPSRPAIARSAPARRVGEPVQRCFICEAPVYAFGPARVDVRCSRCAADIAWRVSLLHQGLKIVSSC